MTATLQPLIGLESTTTPRPGERARRPPTEPRRPQPHQVTAWLIALVAMAGVLRFWNLGGSRLGYDESFTAMAGRLQLGTMFHYLGLNDSHPPLDYLLHAPFARAGVSEFWFRAPSAVLSLMAVALFAWWMRSRGRAGVIATALMAVSAFQIQHGRDARMYAELELLGVGFAVLTGAWLRHPRRWHPPLLGAMILLGLLTHVSTFLLAAGLLTVPGRRTDREAWKWRSAIALGGLGWAAAWGSTFLIQARGGHSSWIPPTSIASLSTAIGRLVTFEPTLAIVGTLATIGGGVLLRRREPRIGRVWIACFAVPLGLAAVCGLLAPVVLDRTFTLMSWAPLVAVAFLVDAGLRRGGAIRVLGAIALVGAFAVIVPSAVQTTQARTGPDVPLRQLELVARPGDIVAVRPMSKAVEMQWSFGVHHHSSTTPVAVPGLPTAFALRIGSAAPSGRVWLLDWPPMHSPIRANTAQCAARWSWGKTRIHCLRVIGT